MTYKSLLGYFSSESTMFTSLPPRRLRWSAWAAGRSSPNCVPAPYSGNVTSCTRQNRSQSDAPGPKTDLIVFGQNALMPWSRALRAGPSGEERCTPHYTVPVSPQCPQEISLLTLPVFQGAAVSSERFSQSLPPRNVAELGGSPPLRGSLEQLDRPSPAGPPFQGTELAALSTPEASLKRLVPLVSHMAVWEPLPSVSYWVLPEQTLVPLSS